MMNNKPQAFLAMTIVLALGMPACRNSPAGGNAVIREQREVIKTYPFSDPDPVPIFARSGMWGRGTQLYPYHFFTKFSNRGIDKEWTVVRLENPYIKVSVLPEVGGKVWGATEKASDKEFLYTNHVLKFREIALRGPWTSGGIEFNFGIVGHAPSTATPVDYLVRKNPDGSASCVVGTMDLPSRTRWSVTITLPKDKAYFETNASWTNPTPFSQSYYSWMCAAVKTSEDLKYIFPGNFQIGHDYAVPLEPWPVDGQGRDLSWYKNNHFGGSKSYFTVGEYKDFYGGWYEKSDFGFGHWARYDDMPGRKVWIWDQSRAGEIWVDLLTDRDGQYTEPQAGRLLNQSDHGGFKPFTADRWREIWFPYKGIGPMVKAAPLGVLSAQASDGILKLGFFALKAVDEDIVVTAGGKTLHTERLRLEPSQVYTKEIAFSGGGADYEVRIGDEFLYSSNPDAGALTRPLRFRIHDDPSAEGLFLAADRLEKERNYGGALEKYLACLMKEPSHVRALSRVAELYCRRGEYPRALEFARTALENSMYDAEANYIFGIISRRLGRLVDAKEALGWASRSMELRSAAYAQLAEIAVLEKAYETAVDYARKALEFNTLNSRALELAAAGYRKLGKPEPARNTIERLLEIDPLDHQARFERYLLEPDDSNLKNFRSLIRNELPHETYLEMAVFYASLGMIDEAVTVLKNAPEWPTVYYWLGYLLKDTSAQESTVYLDKASSLSPRLVFPFREESIPVFEWAIAARPDDWKPKYYLGLIYWGKGRVEETARLFSLCDSSDFAPFFLARASLRRQANSELAAADYERARQIDGKNWRVWHLGIEFNEKVGKKEEALNLAREAAGLFPGEVPVQVDLVRSLMDSGLYEEAASSLDKIEALPYEGASEIHGLYARTHIELALRAVRDKDWRRAVDEFEASKLYPETLGTGKPFEPDERLQDYLASLCLDKMGRREKAKELRKAVLDYTLRHLETGGPHLYFGGLALERAGERNRARTIMEKAERPSPAILDILRTYLQ